MARAAAATDSVLVLSSQTTTDPAAVAAEMGGSDRWMQLYVFRDRAVTDALVRAARTPPTCPSTAGPRGSGRSSPWSPASASSSPATSRARS